MFHLTPKLHQKIVSQQATIHTPSAHVSSVAFNWPARILDSSSALASRELATDSTEDLRIR